MEKEEYLYMIIEEIEKVKKLREENVNKKDFYQKIESKEDIKDFDNNIEYANKTIDSLENLIYLPVYEIIKKMSNNTLMNYKKNILTKIESEISNEYKIIDDLKKEIIKIKNNIESISSAYTKYKKENTVSEYDLNTYIKISKDNVIKIENLNNEIKEHENNINEMMTRRNIIDTKTLEEIRDYLINTYDLNKITYELENYKVTRSDEIIVNLCKDLNALDEVESLIKGYITLRDKSIQKIIEVPNIFKEYKNNIINFILTKCMNINYYEKTNELVIFDEKEIYFMKNNIDMVIKELNNNKHVLINLKIELNDLSNLSFDTINKDLVNFVIELCNTLYLTELEKNNVKSLYNKYIKLVNKKYKTEYSVNKSIYIEKELKYEIKNILDVYWGVLCDRLENIITGIKNDCEFIDNINSYVIHKGKGKMIFDVEHFSEMGLLNMRILIEKVLTKYAEINNELNKFNDDLSNYKNNLIVCKKNKEKELNNIKKRIDELYYKISPNDFPILVSDYDNLNKIFKEKTLINCLVKINRKNLISKVRSESVNFRDKENILGEDVEVIKKKVLNK